MKTLSQALTGTFWSALGGHTSEAAEVVFTGTGGLPSVFPVTDLACAAVGTAALSVADLIREAGGGRVAVSVDRRLSSMWFGFSIRPLGWRLPSIWDSIAGDYPARDGWIRLHTNAPQHRAIAQRILGVPGERAAVARAVAPWAKQDLERAIVEAGGCAAEMRTIDEWRGHPQGQAVAAEPLARVAAISTSMPGWRVQIERPLEGLRVLDLTRVLAGPVATRLLAGYGADVLRIDPPGWDEPGVVPEVTLGKRCARLDLQRTADRAVFEALLAKADILIHGYRPGALERLGFDAAARRRLAPGLIDVCLDAYGWSGPWAGRRGFDSLVQMSAGIAELGMRHFSGDKPMPLPVQALDHATGYLMAAAAIRGVARRLRDGSGCEARFSLARIAQVLTDQPSIAREPVLAAETELDLAPAVETTDWGPARRLASPVAIAGVPMRWDRPARRLGSETAPRWLGE